MIEKFHEEWMRTWGWLVYDKNRDVAFCRVCKESHPRRLLTSERRRELAFVKAGFCTWKNGPKCFRAHESSSTHLTASRAKLTVDRQPEVVQLISEATRKQLDVARTGLTCIVEAVGYIAAQGLAFRRREEETGNLLQLLHLMESRVPELKQWLTSSGQSYTSHHIQNEILRLYASTIEKKILNEIREAECFGIILDETADITRREQMSVCFRYVTDTLDVCEAFLGLYEVPDTTGSTLHAVVRDIMIRCQLDIARLRAKCFDGAASMSGTFKGGYL